LLSIDVYPCDKTAGAFVTDSGMVGAKQELGGRFALLPAIAVALLALGGGAAAGYAPPAEGQMAVVFAPWIDEGQALRTIIAAGGRYVGPSRFGNIVIAYGLDPGFEARVRASGAWLTVAAEGLCSPQPPRTEVI
jgi:hypothetical protein